MNTNGTGYEKWWAEYDRASRQWLRLMFTSLVLMFVLVVAQFFLLFTGRVGPKWTLVLVVWMAVFGFFLWARRNHRRVLREWNAEIDRQRQQAAVAIWTLYR